MTHSDTTASPGGFDPAHQGTEETRWSRFLSDCEEWTPRKGGGLVVVSPHPDDELLGAGGLIRHSAMAGETVTIVSVTDGEAAYRQSALGAVRRQELTAALRKLCMFHINIVRVGIPDGQVSQHINRLRNAVLAVVRESDTLVAPYEEDGHPDHAAAGKVCCEIAHANKLPLARYPIWAWHQGQPETLGRLRWGKFPLASDTRRAKARAIQCFDSQLRPRGLAAILPPHVLEYFARPYEAFVL